MAMRGTSQGMPNIFYKGVEIPAESIEVSSSIGGYSTVRIIFTAQTSELFEPSGGIVRSKISINTGIEAKKSRAHRILEGL
jgi:hypothetical protein